MSDRISLVFEAVDRASRTVDIINSKIEGLQSKTNRSGEIGFAAGAKFAAGFAAVQKAIDLVSSGIDVVASKAMKAAEIETSTVQVTNTLSTLIGQSFEATTDIVDRLNEKIIEQTQVLPGLTGEYLELGRQILDNVLPAAKRLDGSLDSQKLIDYTTEISKAYGLFGKAAGVSGREITNTLIKASGGTSSLNELRRLDLFQKNPALFNALQKELVNRGVRELSELDAVSRIEVLRAVGNRFVTDETVQRLSQTFSGRMETLFTVLFDEQAGIFGFARKLNTRGRRTVLDSINSILGEVMDLMSKIGEILKRAGLTGESGLAGVYDFFVMIASYINRFTKSIDIEGTAKAIRSVLDFLSNLSNSFISLLQGDLLQADTLFNFGVQIGEIITSLFDSIVKSIDTGELLIIVGRLAIGLIAIAGGIVAEIIRYIGARIIEVGTQAAQTLMDGIKGILSTIIEGILEAIDSVVRRIPFLGTINNPQASANIERTLGSEELLRRNDLLLNPQAIPARYDGQIPAVRQEFINSGGAKPVIANSNEYIFNPSQMNDFINSMRSSNQPNINVNVSGIIGDKEAVAKYIIDALNTEWTKYKLKYV